MRTLWYDKRQFCIFNPTQCSIYIGSYSQNNIHLSQNRWCWRLQLHKCKHSLYHCQCTSDWCLLKKGGDKEDRRKQTGWMRKPERTIELCRLINVETDRLTDTYRFFHLTSSTSLFHLVVGSCVRVCVCVLIKLFSIPPGKTTTEIYRVANFGVLVQLVVYSVYDKLLTLGFNTF